MWVADSSGVQLLLRAGDPAPGLGSETYINRMSSAYLNDMGAFVFRSFLTGPGVDATNSDSLWLQDAGVFSLIARAGDAAPGTESGVVFGDAAGQVAMSVPKINKLGQLAFYSKLAGVGIDTLNNEGIWAGSDGDYRLVVREGDPAPGLGDRVVFGSVSYSFAMSNPPMLNSAGYVAFRASLRGPGVGTTNFLSIWAEGPSGLRMIARENEPAPGTEAGVVFNIYASDLSTSPLFNGAGQVAFKAALSGPGVDDSNDWGLWISDTSGQVMLVAREGDLFDVNDDPLIDDYRTISRILLDEDSSGGDGRMANFNDAGQLAFWLQFTDGSQGIFVAQVPEPSTLFLLAAGGIVLIRRKLNLTFEAR